MPWLYSRKLLTKVDRIILNFRSLRSEGHAKHSSFTGHERRMSIGTSSISRNAALARNISDSGITVIKFSINTSHVRFIGAHIRIRHSLEVLYISFTAPQTTTLVLDGAFGSYADLFTTVPMRGPPRR